MTQKQTSNEVSTLASKFMRMTVAEFAAETASLADISRLHSQIKTMAASLLSQDEHKGDR